MIPLLAAAALILVVFGLIIYAFIDVDNRLYANIFALILAMILCFAISMWCFQGAIGDLTPTVINQTQITTTVNTTTTINTTYAYESLPVSPLKDAGIGWIFMFLGFSLVAIILYLGLEAWVEYTKDEEERRYDP